MGWKPISPVSDAREVQPLLSWLARHSTPPAVLLACREHPGLGRWRAPEPGTDRVVFLLEGCLADVSPAGLLEILAIGAPSVTALLDGCQAGEEAAAVVARADQIATALGRDQQVRQATAPPSDGPSESSAHSKRRRLRRAASNPATVPVLDALAMPVARRDLVTGPVLESDPAGSLPGQRHFRVVRKLLGDAPIPDALEAVPTGAADLAAPGCTASGVCVRVCPTDALTLQVTALAPAGSSAKDRQPGTAMFYDDGLHQPVGVDQFVLELDPARCIDCGLCVRQCPEGAMRRDGTLPWSDALAGTPLTLRAALSKRCTRCGATHRGPGPRCEPCTFRASTPFTSRLPPGFTRPGRS